MRRCRRIMRNSEIGMLNTHRDTLSANLGSPCKQGGAKKTAQTLSLVADTTPQSFRLVKQAEKPAPLTQGSREVRSMRLTGRIGVAFYFATGSPP